MPRLTDEQAAERIPALEGLFSPTVDLAEEMLRSGLSTQPDDLLANASIMFLCKQMDHGRALLRLSGHRDSILIARTMFEGLAIIRWIAHKVRIPRVADHSFHASRSQFPRQADHRFHGKPITDSTGSRSRFPREADHSQPVVNNPQLMLRRRGTDASS